MADLTPEQIERLRVVLADSVCDYRRQSRRVPLCVACDARHVAPVVAAMLAEARADERNRIAIYHPDGNIRRSLHLDGRRDAPKFDMRFGT